MPKNLELALWPLVPAGATMAGGERGGLVDLLLQRLAVDHFHGDHRRPCVIVDGVIETT